MSAFRKVTDSLTDTLSFNLDDLDQSISFRTSAEPVLNLDVIDTLAKAAAGNRQLRFNYRKPGARRAESRVVDPYNLANVNGEWFLFAHCHLRNDIRTFTPARISNMQPTGKTFKPPKKFSLEKRLRGSFGIVTGEKKQEIVIRFNELVADYIREKRWHPTQKQRNLRDGGVELTMCLDSLSEVQRWVMTWCGNAQVIKPRELARSVREAAQRILDTNKS
jgi:predicted DNA-binding transcriptional regulator YafY